MRLRVIEAARAGRRQRARCPPCLTSLDIARALYDPPATPARSRMCSTLPSLTAISVIVLVRIRGA